MDGPSINASVAIPRASNTTVLASIIATGALLDPAGIVIHLFENDFIPTPASILADFTEPTYTGYATKTVTAWGTPYLAPDGRAEADSTNVLLWTGPAAGGGPTIYGWYATKSGALVAAARFDSPYPLASDANTLAAVISVYFPPQ